MYNLRYHIASLVAVFLSLSIGLLLGTIVVERGMLDRQRETIVQSLQEEFRSLDAENRQMREALSSSNELIETLLAVSIEGELEGRTVLVVTSVGRVDGLAGSTEAIVNAGGTPVTMLLSRPSFGIEEPALSSVATAVIGPVEPDALLTEVATTLATEWHTAGAERPLTDALVSEGVLRIDGDPGVLVPADALVFLALFDGVPDEGALALASAFASEDRPACGVQAVGLETGIAAAAVESGLSAVDHVGTPAGTFSLTWVLTGRATGHFGTGDAAQSPWPR